MKEGKDRMLWAAALLAALFALGFILLAMNQWCHPPVGRLTPAVVLAFALGCLSGIFVAGSPEACRRGCCVGADRAL